MEILKQDILIEIFLKVPIKSVLACKCVCRTWCNLIRQRDFVHIHLIQSTQERYINNLIVQCCPRKYLDYDSLSDDMNYLSLLDEYDLAGTRKTCHYLDAAIPRFNCNIKIIGSCNGLLCVEGYRPNRRIYICNPITRESVLLSTFTSKSYVFHGFGFDSWTGQYKVVRSFSNCDYRTEICTVENPSPSSWRRIENSPLPICLEQYGVFADGALHWVNHPNPDSMPISSVIVSLDMREEKFRVRPLPNFIKDRRHSRGIHEWRGHLSMFGYPSHNCIQIWVLKDCKGRMNWTEELRIEWSDIHVFSFQFVPLGIKKNGEILLSCFGDLASFDINNRRFTFLEVRKSSKYKLYWMTDVLTLVSPSAHQ